MQTLSNKFRANLLSSFEGKCERTELTISECAIFLHFVQGTNKFISRSILEARSFQFLVAKVLQF